MLSESQKEVQIRIESKLSGSDKDDALLFHVSVERKLNSVNLWLQYAAELIPPFIKPDTFSTGRESIIDMSSFLIRISAYIDAFFMSSKSTLDCFGHEVRSIYGLGGHTGDLYFENILDLLPIHHSVSKINSYICGLNIRSADWFKELKSYRKASAHESIVPIEPTANLDFLTGQWKLGLLKLPIDPAQRPLLYNGKNFIDTGKLIKENLYDLIVKSYDEILNDIQNNKTKMIM